MPPENGIPTGGEIGQILVKQSSQDYDVSWKNQRICVNPNLLVNPYFLHPINQRGETSWSTGQTIDRWRVVGDAEIGESGVRIINPEGDESIIFQIMDGINLADGIPRTVSYLDSNGDLYYGPLTDSYTTYGNFKFTYATGVGFYIRTLDSSISIQCVKLEVGTEQTLARYVNGKWVLNDIPDYSAELLKCQRYLQVINAPASGHRMLGLFTPHSNTDAFIVINTPTTMRADASATYTDIRASGNFTEGLASKQVNLTNYGVIPNGMQYVVKETNGTFVPGQVYRLEVIASTKFIMSCEL